MSELTATAAAAAAAAVAAKAGKGDDGDDEDEDEDEDEPRPSNPAERAFQDAVHAKEKATGTRALLLGRLAVPDDVEDGEHEDGTPWAPTAADFDKVPVAYVSAATKKKLDAVAGELYDVDGSDDDEDDEDDEGGGKFSFRMTNTSSSYHGHEVLRGAIKEAAAAVKAQKWADAFSAAFAATVAGKNDEYWCVSCAARVRGEGGGGCCCPNGLRYLRRLTSPPPTSARAPHLLSCSLCAQVHGHGRHAGGDRHHRLPQALVGDAASADGRRAGPGGAQHAHGDRHRAEGVERQPGAVRHLRARHVVSWQGAKAPARACGGQRPAAARATASRVATPRNYGSRACCCVVSV
jgi:hypothetical protein